MRPLPVRQHLDGKLEELELMIQIINFREVFLPVLREVFLLCHFMQEI